MRRAQICARAIRAGIGRVGASTGTRHGLAGAVGHTTGLIMGGNLQFQYPWVLLLLALLPVYGFLHGRVGKVSGLGFPSADIARPAGAAARAAVGRLLLFLRILAVALCIVALAGPRFANDRTETEASGVDIMLVLDLS